MHQIARFPVTWHQFRIKRDSRCVSPAVTSSRISYTSFFWILKKKFSTCTGWKQGAFELCFHLWKCRFPFCSYFLSAGSVFEPLFQDLLWKLTYSGHLLLLIIFFPFSRRHHFWGGFATFDAFSRSFLLCSAPEILLCFALKKIQVSSTEKSLNN